MVILLSILKIKNGIRLSEIFQLVILGSESRHHELPKIHKKAICYVRHACGGRHDGRGDVLILIYVLDCMTIVLDEKNRKLGFSG